MRKFWVRSTVAVVAVIIVAQLSAQIFLRTFYHRYEPKGIFWYLDGIVIDGMKLTDGIYLNKIFLEANPFRLLFANPKYVVIKDMIITAQKIPTSLKLPIPKAPFIFEKITLAVPYQNRNYILYGDIKTFDLDHHQLNFESAEEGLQMSLTVDLTLQKKRLIAIAMNADEFSADRPEMKIKRGNAWLNFDLQDGYWQPSGEIEAGLITYAGQVFLDAHLTINPVNLLFSAKDENNRPINIETQSNRVTELQTRLMARQASRSAAHSAK